MALITQIGTLWFACLILGWMGMAAIDESAPPRLDMDTPLTIRTERLLSVHVPFCADACERDLSCRGKASIKPDQNLEDYPDFSVSGDGGFRSWFVLDIGLSSVESSS